MKYPRPWIVQDLEAKIQILSGKIAELKIKLDQLRNDQVNLPKEEVNRQLAIVLLSEELSKCESQVGQAQFRLFKFLLKTSGHSNAI